MTINSKMRKALWNSLGDNMLLQERLIQLGKEDGKNIWEKLNQQMPKYAIFKSDRPSTDEDSEAQEPIQMAIKKHLNQNRRS